MRAKKHVPLERHQGYACKECYFYEDGLCRRYPPQPAKVIVCGDTDWCGEFLPHGGGHRD